MDEFENKVDEQTDSTQTTQPMQEPVQEQPEATVVNETEPTEKKAKKSIKKFSMPNFKQIFINLRHIDVQKMRINTTESLSYLQTNAKTFVVLICAAILLMLSLAVVVFFSVVQGQEKVMVPNVVEKPLTDALLEMQAKELYPKIQLRYSEVPGDAGTILEQNPSAGAIVKAGRRISLVVSRGIIIDHVEDYVGQILDDVRIQLQTLFAGTTNPLIVLAEPVYKADISAPGTILEQTPEAGTTITEPVTVTLIVSRGPEFENTRIPRLIGNTIEQMYTLMKNGKVVFDFTSHPAEQNEKAGTIVAQQSFDQEFIPNYSRMTAEFAFPETTEDNIVYGLFTENVTNYPYPVPMKVDVQPPEGEIYTLIDFTHPGGNLTIPYAVPRGSILILSIVNRERNRITVR